jgi:hypothetical protein
VEGLPARIVGVRLHGSGLRIDWLVRLAFLLELCVSLSLVLGFAGLSALCGSSALGAGQDTHRRHHIMWMTQSQNNSPHSRARAPADAS